MPAFTYAAPARGMPSANHYPSDALSADDDSLHRPQSPSTESIAKEHCRAEREDMSFELPAGAAWAQHQITNPDCRGPTPLRPEGGAMVRRHISKKAGHPSAASVDVAAQLELVLHLLYTCNK